MAHSTLTSTFLALMLLTAGRAATTLSATRPGPNETFFAGGPCPVSWALDTSGAWKNMSIQLSSGSNTQMVKVVDVVSNIDATVLNTTKWTCPSVTPYSSIYFYELTAPNQSPVYTTRFTIASPTNQTTPAPNATQPDGSPIPWGIGQVLNGSAMINSSSTGLTGTGTLSGSAIPAPTSAVNATSTSWGNVTGGGGLGASCDSSNLCPESAPCCSEFGTCGSGRACLAGCDPVGSFKPQACTPLAICRTANYTFKDMQGSKRMLGNGAAWNGNADTYDFIYDMIGDSAADPIKDGQLSLTVTEANGGTRISSTRSVLYGNVTARIKSAAEAGIVTAFILMSGTKDEIDWEFTTSSEDSGQTNYFWNGALDYTKGQTVNATARASEFHDYTISWAADALTWLIDDKVVRTVTRASTQDNVTQGVYHYPQTPARIQLSIWPAGISSQAQGTIDWAGGMVNWTSANYTKDNHYASYVEYISVQCDNATLATLPYIANSDRLPNSTTTNGPVSVNGSVSATATVVSGQGSLSATSSSVATSTRPWWQATPASSASSAGSPSFLTSTGSSKMQSGEVKSTSSGTSSSSSASQSAHPWSKRDVVPVGAHNVSSFVWTGNSSTGQPQFALSDATTTLFDSNMSGLNVTAFAPLNSTQSSSSSNSNAVGTLTNPGTWPTSFPIGNAGPTPTNGNVTTTANSSESASTLAQKWDQLPTAAHVGVYVGGSIAALLIVVGIGFLWSKASNRKSNQQAYAPIDEGATVPTGPTYSGQEGDLYSSPAPPPQFQTGYVPSSALRSGTISGGSGQQYQGIYIPSSARRGTSVASMSQYEPGYIPLDARMA